MKKNINKKYWNLFYKKKLKINFPSNFAKFVYKFLKLKKNKYIIDVGCGNGRDLFYFAKNKISCLGIDRSNSAIEFSKKIKKEFKSLEIIKLKTGDFTKYRYSRIKKTFSIYSRFTLHAINFKEEEIFFKNIFKCKNINFIFIEARSTKDNLFGKGKKISDSEYITDHYRRFIDIKILKKQISKKFRIIYLKESKGFSKLGKDNPCLIRLIAKKK